MNMLARLNNVHFFNDSQVSNAFLDYKLYFRIYNVIIRLYMWRTNRKVCLLLFEEKRGALEFIYEYLYHYDRCYVL